MIYMVIHQKCKINKIGTFQLFLSSSKPISKWPSLFAAYFLSTFSIIFSVSQLSPQLEDQRWHFSSTLILKMVTRIYNVLIKGWLKIMTVFIFNCLKLLSLALFIFLNYSADICPDILSLYILYSILLKHSFKKGAET